MKPDWNGIYDPKQVYSPEADTYLLLEAALKEIRPGDKGTGNRDREWVHCSCA